MRGFLLRAGRSLQASWRGARALDRRDHGRHRPPREGWVRGRARDAVDRRKVIIEPDRKRIERIIVPLFDSMGRAIAELYARYTAQELRTILDFAARSREIAEAETRKLRAASKLKKPRNPLPKKE